MARRFSCDGYGVMLGGNPTSASPAATSLLYAGEYFDTDMQQYYLRARCPDFTPLTCFGAGWLSYLSAVV